MKSWFLSRSPEDSRSLRVRNIKHHHIVDLSLMRKKDSHLRYAMEKDENRIVDKEELDGNVDRIIKQ